MDKYRYEPGIAFLLKELEIMLKKPNCGKNTDRALLLNYTASYEDTFHNKTENAVKLEKDALARLPEITKSNAHLAANLHGNLGGLYKQMMKYDLAKHHMEKGMTILWQYGLTYTNDTVAQSVNYAVLLGEMGHPEQGIEALQKCAAVVKRYNSDQCLDYAVVQEATACLYLGMGQVKECEKHFDLALAIYRQFYADEPAFIEAKKAEITSYFVQAGVGMAKTLLES